MADVQVERVGHVDVVTIDRPDVRNALRYQSYDELERAVRSTTARCLVITGSDPAFCSGDDVREVMGGGTGKTPTMTTPRLTPAADALLHTDVPDHRRGQRCGGRLGHGAGADGRPAGGLREGEVR
jgi:enoyl-CoA hydratase/carnithine racemase